MRSRARAYAASRSSRVSAFLAFEPKPLVVEVVSVEVDRLIGPSFARCMILNFCAGEVGRGTRSARRREGLQSACDMGGAKSPTSYP